MSEPVLFTDEQLKEKIQEVRDAYQSRIDNITEEFTAKQRQQQADLAELQGIVASVAPAGRIDFKRILPSEFMKIRALAKAGNEQARKMIYGK